MPWRLIKFIVIFAVFLIFIIFNYDNKCNINILFFKLSDVPVFLIVFISFFIGLLFIFPFVFRNSKNKTADKTGGSRSFFGKKTGSKNRYYDADDDKNKASGNGVYGVD